MTETSPPDQPSASTHTSADTAASSALFWQATRALCIDEENGTDEASSTGANNPADLSEAEQRVFAELLAHDPRAREAVLRAVWLEDCVQAVFAADEQAAAEATLRVCATHEVRHEEVRPAVVLSCSRETEVMPSRAGRLVSMVAAACLLAVCVLVLNSRDADQLPVAATHEAGERSGTTTAADESATSPAVRWVELALAESEVAPGDGSLTASDLLDAEATLAGHELNLPLIDSLPVDGQSGAASVDIPEWMLAAVTVSTTDSPEETGNWPETTLEQ